MKPAEARILFFCLIPIGIFILFKAIMLVKTSLKGKIITEIPFLQKSAVFDIPESGVYAIWQKGEYLRKLPVSRFRPVIRDVPTGEELKLIPSLFRPGYNDWSTVQMELFRFSATRGKYSLELGEGSSISAVERAVSSLFPAKKADEKKYYIQIRESQPFHHVLIGIFLIVLAAFCIIGGLVLGILAGEIFPS